MKVKIEETVKKINKLIDSKHTSQAIEIMQLSQAVLSLTHAMATLNNIEKDNKS